MTKSLGYKFVLVSILMAIFIAGCQGQDSSDKYVADQIVVKFKAGTSSEAEAQLNEAMGTTVVYTSPGGYKVLKIPEGKTVLEMVEAYSKQPIVEYAEPSYIQGIPQPINGQDILHEAE